MNPGIYPASAIPMARYIADELCEVPSLRSGCAFRLLTESPLHAWHSHPRLYGAPRMSSPVADIGTTAHDMLLGGEAKICEIDPSAYPSKPTKDNPEGGIPKGWTNGAIRAARDEARANGLTPMLSVDLISVRAMVRAAKDYIAGSQIAGLFDSGESELTVIAQEGETWLRTRPDWLNLNAGISLSYKTTKARVSPDAFGRMVDSMGYGFSLLFYERALLPVWERYEHPIERGVKASKLRHLILAQEQTAPWACSLFQLSPAKAAIERAQVDRAIKLWAKCMAENKWPGYSGRVCSLEPRPWDLAAEEARLIEEEEAAMESA